jgi:microcin C transport system permease protein
MAAEFIANDKPLFVYYKSHCYFPVFKQYPERDFGGTFETEANYRDPFVKKLIEKEGWMLWPLIPYGYDTVNYELTRSVPAPPSAENWLGTDDQGRDLLARLIYGCRFSILFGLSVMMLSAVIGFFMGAIQGYFGGYVDLILQRFTEIWAGLPILFLLITLSSLMEPGFWSLLLLMGLFKWMMIVPIVRAEFLRARNFDYVRAAKSLGIGSTSIILRHILPNIVSAPLTLLPFVLITAISLLSTLDFLGFGLPAGSPSLGEILYQGKNNLSAPWIGISSFVTLSVLLSSLVFIGEGVREAFRPNQMSGDTLL